MGNIKRIHILVVLFVVAAVAGGIVYFLQKGALLQTLILPPGGGGGGGSCACCVAGACGSCNPGSPGGGCPPGTMMDRSLCAGCPEYPRITEPACGNGRLEGGEACETNIGCLRWNEACNYETCKCYIPDRCGNGVLENDENCEVGIECDPSDLSWGCNEKCKCYQPDNCGNGRLDEGEECEPGSEDHKCGPEEDCWSGCTCYPTPEAACGWKLREDGVYECAGACPEGEFCKVKEKMYDPQSPFCECVKNIQA